ncbi:MAG: hypothetical protein ACYTGG_10535 [Planctomycetota bacterium]|jgi:hypothetical protein
MSGGDAPSSAARATIEVALAINTGMIKKLGVRMEVSFPSWSV